MPNPFKQPFGGGTGGTYSTAGTATGFVRRCKVSYRDDL